MNLRNPVLASVLAAVLGCVFAVLLTALAGPGAAGATHTTAAADSVVGHADLACTCPCDGSSRAPSGDASAGEGVTDTPEVFAPAPLAAAPSRVGRPGTPHACMDRRPPCLDGPRRPPRVVQAAA